jgi:transcriptional regulator with XRE-family HTH domain
MATTEFGQAVRRWRDRAAPDTAGLPAGGHRRAAGLRREELALLAGISVDYVTRLEQGRAASPSAQVVEALARALRLSSTERAYLFRLAGLVPPGLDTVPAYITPSVQRMLDRLAGTPRRGLRRGLEPARGQPAVRGAAGRSVGRFTVLGFQTLVG